MDKNKAVSEYLRKVKVHLKCPSVVRKRILSNIKQDLDVALEKNTVTPDAIESVFGAPEEVAEGYFSSLDQEEMQKEIRRRSKKHKRIILVCVAGTLFFACVLAIVLWTDMNRNTVYVSGSLVSTTYSTVSN